MLAIRGEDEVVVLPNFASFSLYLLDQLIFLVDFEESNVAGRYKNKKTRIFVWKCDGLNFAILFLEDFAEKHSSAYLRLVIDFDHVQLLSYWGEGYVF